MANGYIGLANIGNDYYKIGSTAYVELNAGTNGSITQSADKVDFVVPFDGFVNATGATIHVKFVQANTVSDKTLYLKVGGTDPYQIINPNGSETWAAGSVISFTFDGEHWVMNSSQISVDASQLDIPGFGNISKAGTLTNSAAAAATGDALVIVDTSDNEGRVAKSNILFNTANTDYFLTQAGGWTQLNKSVWGLDNVTNHAQVTSLQWDSTNKKITYKVSEGSAQNVVEFEQGNNITLTAVANTNKLTIAGTANDAVTQTNTTGDATYNLLFSYSTSTADTKTEGTRKHSALTYNPSTGTLTATKFSGDGSGLTNVTASSIQWGAIDNKPTTLSGYGITDAKIDNGVITLGNNTITPVTSVNNKTGSSVTITAGDLGLAAALRFVGTTTSDISDGWTGVPAGINNYTKPIVGDVVLKGDAEYVCTSITGTEPNIVYTWELLGRDGSFALSTEVINKSVFDAAYQLLYSTGASQTAVLNPNADATRKFLRMTGTGSAGTAPVWDTVTKTDVGLSDVENTKLSTWTGSNKITTLGTITTGTWHGTAIEAAYIGGHSTDKLTSGTLDIARGGTGINTYTKGDILYASAANTLSKLSVGTNSDGYVLTLDGGVPVWSANQATDNKVEQIPYATKPSSSTVFNLLFKNTSGDTTETAGVKYSTISGQKLTWDAATGTLSSTKFSGDGSGLTGITTDHIGGTGNGTKYLRQDGWKTVTLATAKAITSVSHNNDGVWPTVSDGTAATFEVINGVLIITPGSNVSYSTSSAKFPTVNPSYGDFANGTITVQ